MDQFGGFAGQPLNGSSSTDAPTLYAVGISSNRSEEHFDGGATWTRKTVGNDVPFANLRHDSLR